MREYSQMINGTEFTFAAEEALLGQLRPLLAALEKLPPEDLRDGFVIEGGFSAFILQKTPQGYRIRVPDYLAGPFAATTDDLTLALWVQLEQADLLRRYGIEGRAVRFDDEIAVAKGALEKPVVCMQRFADLGGAGWCIRAVETGADGAPAAEAADEYEAVYAYRLLRLRPALLKALVLPVGYLAVFDGDETAEILNERNESVL